MRVVSWSTQLLLLRPGQRGPGLSCKFREVIPFMAFSFFGGVHPKDWKELAREQSIQIFPAPQTLVIPLSQHIGAPCKPLVTRGDHVDLGQRIGDGSGLCVPVHASVSGTVKAVEARPHSSGTTVPAVVLENDFLETRSPEIRPRRNLDGLSAQDLIDLIRQAGVVGMGGATFPTHAKLASALGKVDTILVNASECEPYITADERLLREQPHRVLRGLEVLMRILGLEKAVVAMEDNKPQAATAVRAALMDHPGVRLRLLRTRYPQGAEKQLIQSITGRQVPPGGLPAAVGCAVFNAATCAAVCDAVWDGMPLVQRVVTVSGDIAMEPRNLLVPIGTPFTDMIDAVGFRQNPYKVLSGGPMMGLAQFDLTVPVTKGTNGVTILGEANRFAAAQPHCIRCGRCVQVCPMHLMPLYLYSAERRSDTGELSRRHVTDCVECGSCAYTCPACVPLVQSIRTAKQKLRDAQQAAKPAAEPVRT